VEVVDPLRDHGWVFRRVESEAATRSQVVRELPQRREVGVRRPYDDQLDDQALRSAS
jgi:DNA-directed RNA polymerase specialized sigma subunit